jgi:hypothetical protein
MSPISRPAVALPEPLRASEIPSFTNYSVVVRLPDIARRVLNENHFPTKAAADIEALIAEIPEGKIRQVAAPLARDSAQWAGYIQPYSGMNWLEVPWFFAEEYFYLRILEATGYFHPGDGQGKDPYAGQKHLGLVSSRDAIHSLAEHTAAVGCDSLDGWREALARLLLADLWGNQNDLSMWPVQKTGSEKELTGGKAGHPSGAETSRQDGSLLENLHAARKNILSDDLPDALDYICRLSGSSARVDMLLDNAGYELVCDLALADFLLSSRRIAQVTVHAKSHPVFVSDVIEKDFHGTLDFLVFNGNHASQTMAIRLREHLVTGRLILRCHPFWSSPLAAWDMPEDLYAEIGQARLLIVKGDANYRRLLGDRHWPVSLPFSRAVDYLPCPVLALRTLKSEIAVGIQPNQIPADDPQWMINGRWGVVQFALPRSA